MKGDFVMYKKLFVAIVALFIASSAFAADLSIEAVIANMQVNQAKINDMYAETTTTITSNMAIPGQESKGPQKMVQKAKMWTKGQDKSKIEMLSPMKQITITNGDMMATINQETGQKAIQDLKKLREKSGGLGSGGQMSLDKAKEFFDLSVRKLDASTPGTLDTHIITGIPKKENKFLGKMEFYVDSEKWVPVKILMYDTKGKPMSQSEIQYQEISDLSTEDLSKADVYVPVKNISNVTTP